ncbi:hypothetical protein MIC97_23840 [Aquamicrobium sp. NLF2-7]|uniref:hypothetical protein n=1 Tax=Aquamicrobium sp. NLF2-7 TaxID=2918753 RepID=UPI001EFA3E1B|nr:hypothetical protein [Aquamicrobium sp. NLF2-7]MCG8274521.1 hypothetical protein [Aquamicrobium sp. NLF2-7]
MRIDIWRANFLLYEKKPHSSSLFKMPDNVALSFLMPLSTQPAPGLETLLGDGFAVTFSHRASCLNNLSNPDPSDNLRQMLKRAKELARS